MTAIFTQEQIGVSEDSSLSISDSDGHSCLSHSQRSEHVSFLKQISPLGPKQITKPCTGATAVSRVTMTQSHPMIRANFEDIALEERTLDC